jgi:two-component system sensor histidine kinase KdpD
VVIGFVECHGRQNTEELIEGLEMVPRKVVEYRGSRLAELDLDAVLRRQPQLALVDELVDSSPEQLRCRMLHGNIYPPDRVPQALTHFFRTDNLTALRELALRFLADETDEELLEHLRQQEAPVVWETAERVLVAVTAAPGTDALLRRAARMASRLKADLDVVHVSGGDRGGAERRALDKLRELAADLGARWLAQCPATAIAAPAAMNSSPMLRNTRSAVRPQRP